MDTTKIIPMYPGKTKRVIVVVEQAKFDEAKRLGIHIQNLWRLRLDEAIENKQKEKEAHDYKFLDNLDARSDSNDEDTENPFGDSLARLRDDEGRRVCDSDGKISERIKRSAGSAQRNRNGA